MLDTKPEQYRGLCGPWWLNLCTVPAAAAALDDPSPKATLVYLSFQSGLGDGERCLFIPDTDPWCVNLFTEMLLFLPRLLGTGKAARGQTGPSVTP